MFRNEFMKAETLEDLKRIYKRLAMKFHPDRGGDEETMKQINNLYDEFFAKLKNVHRAADGKTYTSKTSETPGQFKDIIDALLRMDGVIIEIIGCFVWVSGNTKAYKEELKALGLRWQSKKKMWYKAPDGYRRRYSKKREYSIGEIRSKYGTSGQFMGHDEEMAAAV